MQPEWRITHKFGYLDSGRDGDAATEAVLLQGKIIQTRMYSLGEHAESRLMTRVSHWEDRRFKILEHAILPFGRQCFAYVEDADVGRIV